jgi:predicted ribosomally synthesized peptide with SipW-like signal peptide
MRGADVKAIIPVVSGAIGAGALGLALVGPGGFASFTSATTADQSIKAGTFQLEAVAGSPSVNGPLVGDANAIGQPQLSSSTGTEPAVPDGNTVTFTLWNIAPGDTYTEPITMYDVGTLQGQVDTVTYKPATTSNALKLEQYLKVTVQVQSGNTWVDVHTNHTTGATGVPEPATGAYTFYLTYSFGPQFMQPNPTKLTPTQASSKGLSTNELSASFRVVFSFTDTQQSQNTAEGMSAAPSLTFNGVNTP